MTTDKIIAAAREARLLPDNAHPAPETPHMRAKTAALANFYAIAYRAGMERAAEIFETTKEWRGGKWVSTLCPLTTSAIAATIRAHAKNQPESTHDTGNV